MAKTQGPFLVVNPKSYLYGQKSLELAKKVDEVCRDVGITVYFTCPYADVRLIRENTKYLTVCVQSIDPLKPGRGMGHVLADSLKEAGAGATFINHAENPKTLTDYHTCIKRARELGMVSIACADSIDEAKAVACMNPDIVLAEPTDLIGTGIAVGDEYTIEACKALRAINPNVQPMIAFGVSTPDDCYRVCRLGADGTGGTSGIINAPDPGDMARQWAEAILRGYNERIAEEG